MLLCIFDDVFCASLVWIRQRLSQRACKDVRSGSQTMYSASAGWTRRWSASGGRSRSWPCGAKALWASAARLSSLVADEGLVPLGCVTLVHRLLLRRR